MRTEVIEVDEVLKDTGLAFLFRIGSDEMWVPHSVITDPDEIEVGDVDIEVEAAHWFAEREGLA